MVEGRSSLAPQRILPAAAFVGAGREAQCHQALVSGLQAGSAQFPDAGEGPPGGSPSPPTLGRAQFIFSLPPGHRGQPDPPRPLARKEAGGGQCPGRGEARTGVGACSRGQGGPGGPLRPRGAGAFFPGTPCRARLALVSCFFLWTRPDTRLLSSLPTSLCLVCPHCFGLSLASALLALFLSSFRFFSPASSLSLSLLRCNSAPQKGRRARWTGSLQMTGLCQTGP